jgi:cytochrome P450
MASYLEKIEQTPPKKRWRLVRQWMGKEPLPLYEELREHRPVLELPELTIVTRFHDCVSVLSRHEVFSVRPYKDKQGDYWMAQDDTARHWREKSIMRSVLDLEELPEIRRFVAETASALLRKAKGAIEAVNGLCRAVPIALVQERFGFEGSDPKELFEWSYWNQYDAFHNQPFDSVVVKNPESIVKKRQAANARMAAYLIQLIQSRAQQLQAGTAENDPVTRLLKLSRSGAVQFDLPRVVQNVGGLLIGAVETTSHAAINALAGLLGRPPILAQAVRAAAAADPRDFDGYVFEALRFNPAFPYFFRTSESAAVLAAGTDYAHQVQPGTTVMALTHSAMFDAVAFAQPQKFDATRSLQNAFHFGYGIHECLGRHVGRQMIPEIVRQVLLLPGIRAAGKVDKKRGPVPESYRLRWDTKSHRRRR